MGDLSKNFSRYEFACPCGCGFDTVDTELLNAVQDVRDHFKKATIIVSGCRCKAYNKAIRGAKNSQHMYGRAADIRVAGVSRPKVQKYLKKKYIGKWGIGSGKTITHIDTRSGSTARWTY